MAPETFTGAIDKASDQYSLALVAYELLTGQSPFSGDLVTLIGLHRNQPLPQFPTNLLEPTMARSLYAVLARAAEKDSQSRYPSILDFVEAFYNVVVQNAAKNTVVLPMSSSVTRVIPAMSPQIYQKQQEYEMIILTDELLKAASALMNDDYNASSVRSYIEQNGWKYTPEVLRHWRVYSVLSRLNKYFFIWLRVYGGLELILECESLFPISYELLTAYLVKDDATLRQLMKTQDTGAKNQLLPAYNAYVNQSFFMGELRSAVKLRERWAKKYSSYGPYYSRIAPVVP